MEKDKLDEFFNQKLPRRSFEPTEEYWKQAEALIDAEEKKRRNWKFLWWGLGIFLLLSFGIAWNWQSKQFIDELEGEKTSEVLTETTNSNSTKVNENKTSKTFTEKENLKNTTEESNTDASETNTKIGASSFATAKINKNNTGSSDELRTSNTNTTNQPKTKTASAETANQLLLKNKTEEYIREVKNEKETLKNENTNLELKDTILNNEKNIAINSSNIENKNGQENQFSIIEKNTDESKDEKELVSSFKMETLNLESLLFSMDELDRELDLGPATPYESEYPCLLYTSPSPRD